MPVSLVLGLQFGDEGKGKIVDYLADKSDIVVRYQGGNNAGHTVVNNNVKYKLNLIPSGAIRGKTCLIGNGVVVDLEVLFHELETLSSMGIFPDIKISSMAHVILPLHKQIDSLIEKFRGKSAVGTTKKGIGPTYMDKVSRLGIRIGDLLDPESLSGKLKLVYDFRSVLIRALGEEPIISYDDLYQTLVNFGARIKDMVVNGPVYLNEQIADGKNILLEGAQGTMLDIDFGSYPYVTSSNTTAGGSSTGSGIAPRLINEIIGVLKAYQSRVGAGPFPTELNDETGEMIQKRGHEFGTVTGRPRRCGWLDLVIARYAVMLSGVSKIALTKVDVLSGFDKIKVATRYEINGEELKYPPKLLSEWEIANPIYEELDGWHEFTKDELDAMRNNDESGMPYELRKYIEFIESNLDVPVSMISFSPDRNDTLLRDV